MADPGLSPDARAAVARLMQAIDRARLADGRAVIGPDGRLTSRALTPEEVASGEYPLAALLPRADEA